MGLLNGQRVLCIYQEGNIDSFVGAWALWKVTPNATFHSSMEQEAIHRAAGMRVYLMGSVVPNEQLFQLAAHHEQVTVIDHSDTFGRWVQRHGAQFPNNLKIVYDHSRSIASLAWDVFSHHQERAPLINLIEDKATWRYQYPETRPVMAALTSYHENFDSWDDLIMRSPIADLVEKGRILLQGVNANVNTVLRNGTRPMDIGGFQVPTVNVPPNMASEVCIQLAKGAPFAAGYWDTQHGRVYSLISVQGGVDVSEVVERLGGHGSRHEAGFEVPYEHPLATA